MSIHSLGYITVQAFAEYLFVSDKTVMKWIKAGVLPAYRFHSEWRIAVADAEAFIESARFQAGPV